MPHGRTARARRPGPVAASVAVLMLVGLAGCASPQDGAVRDVAGEFASAIGSGDGAAACRLLAPRTKSELEQSAGKACAKAVLEEDVPSGTQDRTLGNVDVYGTAAWVQTGNDTVFLARFQGGWKVSAAGCTKTTPRMYDCVVKGG